MESVTNKLKRCKMDNVQLGRIILNNYNVTIEDAIKIIEVLNREYEYESENDVVELTDVILSKGL